MTTANPPQAVSTDNAPGAIGPYSQGICAGGFGFLSGQLGLDPATGEMVTGGVEAQAHQAMRNLEAVAQAAGADLQQVVKTTIFLKDMGDFAAVNAVYGQYFQSAPPARSTVQVAALPKDGAVEIEAVVALV